jgi:hypothetical protein
MYAHISGFLLLDAWGHIRQIGLNQEAPLAPVLLSPFQTFVAPAHVAIYLAQSVMSQSDVNADENGLY